MSQEVNDWYQECEQVAREAFAMAVALDGGRLPEKELGERFLLTIERAIGRLSSPDTPVIYPLGENASQEEQHRARVIAISILRGEMELDLERAGIEDTARNPNSVPPRIVEELRRTWRKERGA